MLHCHRQLVQLFHCTKHVFLQVDDGTIHTSGDGALAEIKEVCVNPVTPGSFCCPAAMRMACGCVCPFEKQILQIYLKCLDRSAQKFFIYSPLCTNQPLRTCLLPLGTVQPPACLLQNWFLPLGKFKSPNSAEFTAQLHWTSCPHMLLVRLPSFCHQWMQLCWFGDALIFHPKLAQCTHLLKEEVLSQVTGHSKLNVDRCSFPLGKIKIFKQRKAVLGFQVSTSEFNTAPTPLGWTNTIQERELGEERSKARCFKDCTWFTFLLRHPCFRPSSHPERSLPCGSSGAG